MLLKDLEIVTYDEAADMLGVVKGTIAGAVNRGALTPLPRQRRKPGRLAKQQVELFTGKELSLANLTHEQAVKWHEINRVVNAHKKASKRNANALAYENVQSTIEIAGDLLDRIADLLIDVVGGIVTSKDISPETLVSLIQQSPAFSRIAELLGMPVNEIPDETMYAIHRRAMQVAEKVKTRIATLFFETMLQDDKLPDIMQTMFTMERDTETVEVEPVEVDPERSTEQMLLPQE